MSIVSASIQPAKRRPPSIGILGGVGAIASARFHLALVEEWARVHDAKTDDDFPQIVHVSYPCYLTCEGMTDRRASENAMLASFITHLDRMHGPVAVVCNSLTPIVPRNPRFLTPVTACKHALEGVSRAWLLASDSTIRDCIYQDAYPHVEWLIPEMSLTPAIQTSITGGFDLAMQLPDEDTVVLGCTELSTQAFIHPKVISPTDEMIRILCSHESPPDFQA